jgi:hypothetical protein
LVTKFPLTQVSYVVLLIVLAITNVSSRMHPRDTIIAGIQSRGAFILCRADGVPTARWPGTIRLSKRSLGALLYFNGSSHMTLCYDDACDEASRNFKRPLCSYCSDHAVRPYHCAVRTHHQDMCHSSRPPRPRLRRDRNTRVGDPYCFLTVFAVRSELSYLGLTPVSVVHINLGVPSWLLALFRSSQDSAQASASFSSRIVTADEYRMLATLS